MKYDKVPDAARDPGNVPERRGRRGVSRSEIAPEEHHVAAGEAKEEGGVRSWVTRPGRYVEFRFCPRGLRITPTEEGKEKAEELVVAGHAADTATMLDDFFGLGWLFIPAEAIGALTGCTDIITQDFTYNDASEWEPTSPRPCVFAHMNYAVELPVEQWALGFAVFFERGEVERKAAPQGGGA